MDNDVVPEPGGLLIQSTAGAVPIRNEKGEVTMQKVKVKRYVPGKRPDYAPESSSSEDESELPFSRKKGSGRHGEEDARLRRLRERHLMDREEEDEDRHRRHREIHGPEILEEGETPMDDEDEFDKVSDEELERDRGPRKVFRIEADEDSSDEEELEEDEIERRRALMRERAKMRAAEEEELMGKEEEKKSGDEESEEEEEESEYEEESDSEEETGPRLKPVFISRRDRVTVQEKEMAAAKERQQAEDAKRRAEERKRETIRMVETEARKAHEEATEGLDTLNIDVVVTDDENEEEEYEAWKIREMKRVKRDREEREQEERERIELERLRNMTEDERREELRKNPKVITNKAKKGRYKFLQKYYHRGAFFLDEESEIFKRDVSNPTLEDHFDKKVLPKVMQVKNFGRSGRTKYTHLADQDTTSNESPWISETTLSRKFQTSVAGGMKQSFEKPTAKKHIGDD